MAKRQTALEAVPDENQAVYAAGLVERLAKDPAVDVDKLERIMRLQERALERQAEAEWNAAMSAAQAEMRAVSADGTNPQTRSRYATYGAIDAVLRPIYTAHGFALSFDTDMALAAESVRVVCHVSHRGGRSRAYHVDMPADGMGAKGAAVMTKTHAVGSAMSYGMRYLIRMIFNVAVGQDDDDGNAAGRTVTLVAPKGFDAWWEDLQAVAENGLLELEAAWRESAREMKAYVHAVDRQTWEQLKARAAAVDKAKAAATALADEAAP